MAVIPTQGANANAQVDTGVGTQILQNPEGATPAPAVNTPEPMIGNLPVPPGWAIAIGCIGLVMVAGTRFGGIAAGIGGVAVIYQLGGWIVEATQPSVTPVVA